MQESTIITPAEAQALLQVKNLSVYFAMRRTSQVAVDDVSFTLNAGDRMGLVGESGAGKSVTGFSIINLISKPGFIAGGQILFDGLDLVQANESTLQKLRGERICMIFQDPMMTLNPVLTIGAQMREVLFAHKRISKKEADVIAIERLRQVHIPSPERRLNQYPHELSGGMRQRVVIAIALLADPALIIADEPTTALDVTIQAEIMELLQELCDSHKMGLILITHDLGVVAQVTQKVAVMYAGRIVEAAPTIRLIESPEHPYTKGLLSALPQGKIYGTAGTRRRLNQIPGVMPNIASIPKGCAFHPRCERCVPAVCAEIRPELRVINPNSPEALVACHFPLSSPMQAEATNV